MSVDGTRGMGTFVGDNPGGPYKIAEKNPLIMAYLLRGIDASPESFNLPPCIWIYL